MILPSLTIQLKTDVVNSPITRFRVSDECIRRLAVADEESYWLDMEMFEVPLRRRKRDREIYLKILRKWCKEP